MRKTIAALTMLAVTMLSAPSFAACTCTTTVTSSEDSVGRITHSKGEVLYSGKFGFSNAKSGSKLYKGSQVSTGPGATVSVSAGDSCALDVPENSELSLLPVDGFENNICLEVTTEYGQFLPVLAISQLIPLSILAGDAGIVLAVSGGDNSASR